MQQALADCLEVQLSSDVLLASSQLANDTTFLGNIPISKPPLLNCVVLFVEITKLYIITSKNWIFPTCAAWYREPLHGSSLQAVKYSSSETILDVHVKHQVRLLIINQRPFLQPRKPFWVSPNSYESPSIVRQPTITMHSH